MGPAARGRVSPRRAPEGKANRETHERRPRFALPDSHSGPDAPSPGGETRVRRMGREPRAAGAAQPTPKLSRNRDAAYAMASFPFWRRSGMPKKPWIVPSQRFDSTATPADASCSA